MINSRFSVAIHILSLIASSTEPNNLTSEFIAGSVNTNPVVIRRISSQLKKAGLLKSQAGIPGYTLTASPEDINLLTVYRALQAHEQLFSVHEEPNPNCPVGKEIQNTVSTIFASAQQALEDELQRRTLQDVLQNLFSVE